MIESAPHRALPLAGLRVLEYAQYVAGPFAGMLLADLGADVIKVEPPTGDAWRRYEPFAKGESRYFYALNRNKRSVVLDLKSEEGLRASDALLGTADAVIHNLPPDRARRFALDRESVRERNPTAVWCCVSALGSYGPEANLTAFDLVAQALSGLLLANAQGSDAVPRRAGGIAMADFTAGLLCAVAVLAGLVGRAQGQAPGLEVSLLGAALAVQAQRFVSVEDLDGPARADRAGGPPLATPADLERHGQIQRAADELEPYYRSYAASDGFFVLACLHEGQRLAAAEVVGVEDSWAANPQAPPSDEAERSARRRLVQTFESRIAAATAAEWIDRFRGAGVPAAEIRLLEAQFEHEQSRANGLVQLLQREGVGDIKLLGSPFKINGLVTAARRGIPSLGEHTEEVLSECRQPQT
jgi:crotonobetainyl-CoA:carnitine CoA-transferase CaiB-like acyl-CoA transferase